MQIGSVAHPQARTRDEATVFPDGASFNGTVLGLLLRALTPDRVL
jgi:hypothetical protein